MSKIRYRSGKPFNKKYGGRRSFRMSTPSWWINISMTRPQRRETKLLLKRLHDFDNGELDSHPMFPLAKKPHLYYW